MKPQAPDDAPHDDLFRHRLDNIISLQHPLVGLPNRIDWAVINRLLGEHHEDAVVGQLPKPTRLNRQAKAHGMVLCQSYARMANPDSEIEKPVTFPGVWIEP